eukprot:CAMPEP_0119141872 /NCGR_PEP_ID=MMETSP1310-20130426/31721_1 /TAXON_ID=464262 /ORGANISM="Genus nov. species nov., Strain RCC2339" /LENGTH=340 /DNA_ID=CAMNT_0007133361 /DNA_START=98 /DNA_END=1117 /DNA_ORIENTATION=-
MNLVRLIQNREIQPDGIWTYAGNDFVRKEMVHYNYHAALSSSVAVYQRMKLSATLSQHVHCVNTVNWSPDGQYLASGSDEGMCCIWKHGYPEDESLRYWWNTGHRANIFCAKFLPTGENNVVCTASGDCHIHVYDINQGSRGLSESTRGTDEFLLEPFKKYECHLDRVKKLGPVSAAVFLSAAEDGTIRRFDIRAPHACCLTAGSFRPGHRCKDTLLAYQRNREFCSIAVRPLNASQFIVAGSTADVLLYDQRMPKLPVSTYLPYEESEGRITGVAFNWNGLQIAANYSLRGVYTMDVDGPITGYAPPSSPQSSDSDGEGGAAGSRALVGNSDDEGGAPL